MTESLMKFIVKDSTQEEYTIDQLLREGSGYGIIAGRTGLGKTNILLNLSMWLAMGEPFFGLNTKKSRVLYLGFEGAKQNLQDRYTKIILRRHSEGHEESIPQDEWLHVERKDSFLLSKNKDEFKKLISPFDVVMLDPIKWAVGGDYTKPSAAAEFTKTLIEILRNEGKTAIISMQIRKRDPRVKVEEGDLFELKGAADYVEDATFAMLLERSEMRGKSVPAHEKDRYLTLYFAKHREATEDLAPVELLYNYDKCEFEVVT